MTLPTSMVNDTRVVARRPWWRRWCSPRSRRGPFARAAATPRGRLSSN